MASTLKLRLLDYISKKNKNIDSAFTLVELIVVVVIIGILSSIAVPAFRNASDKARQKEASTLIATYVKAAQAYYTEFGTAAQNAANLSEYIQITGVVRQQQHNVHLQLQCCNFRNKMECPEWCFYITMAYGSNKQLLLLIQLVVHRVEELLDVITMPLVLQKLLMQLFRCSIYSRSC